MIEIIEAPDKAKSNKNVVFLAGPIKGADNWQKDAIDFFKKESSRAAAFGFVNLARLLGIAVSQECVSTKSRIIMAASGNALGKLKRRIEKLSANENHTALRFLAETEHMRWNAFLLLRGVRPWPCNTTTIKGEIVGMVLQKIEEEKDAISVLAV